MAGVKTSRTGPQDEVVKTSARMPRRLLRHVDEMSARLGLTNQSIYTLGTIRLLLELAPMLGDTKKKQVLLQDLQDYFQNHFATASAED